MAALREPWRKPKLIILVRSDQPENVLYHCKTDEAGSVAGPNLDIRQCRTTVSRCRNRCQSEANKWS